MATSHSPLRYPGGKQILARILAHLIATNNRSGGVYAEPYAGGAGAALALLFGGHVDSLMLNDADPRIHSFWSSILNDTDGFLRLLSDTPATIDEWRRQRHIYQEYKVHPRLDVGFATFFLNRCNRSGIIANAGVIGGQTQSGRWKLDARLNRRELALRIERIARYRGVIKLSKFDAITFIRRLATSNSLADKTFVYLDPPYYEKGSQLYLNHYSPKDHAQLASRLAAGVPFKWVMSYDNVPAIRTLYGIGFQCIPFCLQYSARHPRVGSELLIHDNSTVLPSSWRHRIPAHLITAADRPLLPISAEYDSR